MSSFINGALGLPVTIHAATDLRHCDEAYFQNQDSYFPTDMYGVVWGTDIEFRSDSFPWWPGPGQLGCGFDGLSNSGILSGIEGDIFWVAGGSNGRLAFSGYTRDQYGSPLGNCTVRCIRSSTDEMVSKVSSDANGFYIATSPYNDGHFLVIHDSTGTLAGATTTSAVPA